MKEVSQSAGTFPRDKDKLNKMDIHVGLSIRSEIETGLETVCERRRDIMPKISDSVQRESERKVIGRTGM